MLCHPSQFSSLQHLVGRSTTVDIPTHLQVSPFSFKQTFFKTLSSNYVAATHTETQPFQDDFCPYGSYGIGGHTSYTTYTVHAARSTKRLEAKDSMLRNTISAIYCIQQQQAGQWKHNMPTAQDNFQAMPLSSSWAILTSPKIPSWTESIQQGAIRIPLHMV